MGPGKKKINVVVGMGEIGKPLFHLLSKQDVPIGIDLTPVEIHEKVSFMHVCYPYTDHALFVRTTTDYCRKYRPEIVIIHSTVTPGTTRHIESAAGIPIVYSPVRGKHTKMESDLLMYTKFIAGTDADAVKQVEKHFNQVGIRTKIFSQPETAELAKLLETTYFGLLIAWAQEMNRFSEQHHVDYYEMAQFFEEISYLPRSIFQPGFIGGHCVMPNIELLKSKFQSEFLNTIKHSNDKRASELGINGKEQPKRVEPLNLHQETP